MNSLVGVAAPSDLVESFLVEILHSVEGGDVKQGFSSLETILLCVQLLSLTLVLYIFMLILLISLYA